MTVTLVEDPGTRLSQESFFALVTEVLAATGRGALNAEQQRIIEVRDSDVVTQILAGPGSGKTEVLIWRVLYELVVRGTDASRLMVTTFTRKAAQELSVRIVERSDALLQAARDQGIAVDDPRVHDLRIGTIHSLCDRLLAEFDEQYMERGTALIDDVETRIRLARVRAWLFKDAKNARVLDRVLQVDPLTALFRPPWRDREGGLQKVDLALAVLNQHVETWIPRCAVDGTRNGVEQVHGPRGLTRDLIWLQEQWETYLDRNHILDFATLQKRFWERQAGLAREVDHVFVDELQDTNPIQYAIHLGWADAGGVRLTGVGDDDQALYRWRGSDIACFANLEGDCARKGIAYRIEVLEENRRSTANIVDFAQAFRDTTALGKESLPKTVHAPKGTAAGKPVRLLQGEWAAVCRQVAKEAKALGAGSVPAPGGPPAPTVAVLFFSTSEVESQRSTRPALDLRRALEARGLRVYNPRNKAAARPGSPVHSLLGIVSYLIDPVTKAPAGKKGREVEVWASCGEPDKVAFAVAEPPPFFINGSHAGIQKKFIKSSSPIGSLDAPGPDVASLLAYIDDIRERLVRAEQAGRPVRLTLSGLVARLLRMEPFRSSGYTVNLFRQALFTQLLEANVAATRQTRESLDRPMAPKRVKGKIVWPTQYWSMLNVFGQMVADGGQDDLEVEAFSEHAISLLTFHQAKGLEFDHVYVGVTGNELDPSAALATELFSGKTPSYGLVDGQPVTPSKTIRRLASADRAREIYVAITRAKKRLTVLHAPHDQRWGMQLHAGLEALFADQPPRKSGALEIRDWAR